MRTRRRSWALAAGALLSATMVAGAAPPARIESARATPQRSPERWWAQVQGKLAAAEYEVTWQGETVLVDVPAAWQAPNRAHDFRTYFTGRAIRVVPRAETKPSWEWGLALVGYGRGGQVWPVAEATARPTGNRIEYARRGIVEWYENAPRGLEQGFGLAGRPGEAYVDSGAGPEATIAPRRPHESLRRPAHGEGAVFVQLSLTGTLDPVVSTDGQSIDFRTPGGVNVVHYAHLRVTDASGRELPAWMEGFAAIAGRTIRIVFDDTDAAYPVTIDPLATSPAWTAESNKAFSSFGVSVATAGDVNGDGYSDVIIGAPRYDNGQTDEGRAFVYLGSASGLAASPAWTAESDQTNAELGVSVATAGDVNGDGYSDVIVGAHWYESDPSYEGRAYVYLGSASGLASSPVWTAAGGQAGAEFGRAVATAGDVNGDGYSDVIVGAPWNDNGETDEGRVYVYLGSGSGPASSPAWTAESDQPGAAFGISASAAGDVDGDGYSDVIVGAYLHDNGQTDEGRAYVYLGSASGLASAPAWTAESDPSSYARFGISVGTAGDVNGDGYSDVIVGADGYDTSQSWTDEGRAYVYLGSASGLAASPAWAAAGDQWFANFGIAVATAGDVDGDGYADVIVGAYAYDNGESDEGRAYVYLGSASGLASSPVSTVESQQSGAYFGVSVATAGDVNGDGYSDVIVGADWYDNGETDEGRAYVYLGSTSGLAASPGWTAESDQASANFGWSVAMAGDVNGDGYSDVIVGAYLYDNGQTDEGRAFLHLGSASGLASSPAWTGESNQASAFFGWTVAAAGDVNGDGYSDVIVGAPYHDNGQTDEGRTYVYSGSASGLSAFPVWTAESDQASSSFGYSVATAGDVNGDGYSDVIVGATQYDNGQTDEGRASGYLGSASGLSAVAGWTAESDQSGANFGRSVATAGDVNGDGYSDVIVGAFFYDNGQTDEGRASVYLGSASGLSAVAGWTAESDQAGARFGNSVATAGDVNGDGYSDVIVGAYFHDNGQTDEGRASVYLGSASGLASSPAWTAESNQALGYFGNSVATAGDVNGDGYSDVIVGAYLYDNGQTDEGRASLYLGSASGLSAVEGWTAESDQAGARLGSSVATAGDVNGDGYSDVIVGAPYLDSGQPDEGRAFVHYGGGGRHLALRPQQRRADDAKPIQQLGRSDSPTSFRLAALGRSPFGRGGVKLEWEAKPLGTLLDGSETSTGASWLDSGTAGAALDELVSGLAAGRVYHWRVRLHYEQAATPFVQRSRWFAIPWKGRQEADLRTGGAGEAGRVPDGSHGAPLRVSTASGGQLTLAWDASCLTTDTDYEIYEGIIGSYYSHTAYGCSTGGATATTISPSSGNRYYLVVPRNVFLEGSYGTDSRGLEIPRGASACLEQRVGACP